MKILAVLFAGSFLASCATVTPQVQLTVAQGMSAAEAGVDGANIAATAAANSGALKGPAALKVKTYIDTANNATSAAHTAYTAGNLTQAAAAATQALQAIASANDATPKAATP